MRVLVVVVALLVVASLVVLDNPVSFERASLTETATDTWQKTPSGIRYQVIATQLEVPWDVVLLPEGGYLVTERAGRVLLLGERGQTNDVVLNITNKEAESKAHTYILGIALHPDFTSNSWVYVYLRESEGELAKVVRYVLENEQLSSPYTVIEGLPGVNYEGGRLRFGPDGYLYIGVGAVHKTANAQESSERGGKILRVRDDGVVPEGNPFGTVVYSLGHRNPQGLAWDSEGALWSTDHGRSGVLAGFDEINQVVPGGNYGWPLVEGNQQAEQMMLPYLHSGATTTWAPADLVWHEDRLLVSGLLSESIYELRHREDGSLYLESLVHKDFGRIRTILPLTDGSLLITTSNRDGRGEPIESDDRLIKLWLE